MNVIESTELGKGRLDVLAMNSLSAAADWSQRSFAGPSTAVPGKADSDIQPQPPSLIKTIPVEILEIVMWEVVKDSQSLSIPHYYDTVTQLRLVCRHWTRVLEGVPRIWANLSLSMDERLIDLALSRSMRSPLTITGYLFPSSVLDKLFQHIYRWKYLDVYLEGDSVLDRFALHSAPLLEELRLQPPLSSTSRALFNDSAPMLRIVHLRSCGVEWSASLLSNLHELVLLDVQEGVPDVGTFLKVLASSPQLTRLRVHSTQLTHSPSPQTRVSLSSLSSLELEYLGQGILKQLVESIDIPTSTKCLFSITFDDYESTSIYEQLEPIGQRLQKLADIARGTTSTLSLSRKQHGWNVRMTYEGEAHQLGPLAVDVEASPRSNIDLLEYFAHQLGQGEPNPVPPILHLIDPPYLANFDNQGEILERIHNHLPDTDKILMEDASVQSIEGAFNTLFPSVPSPRTFLRLSSLTIRKSMHEKWADWILGRQKRPDVLEGLTPLPLETLRLEGGVISAEKLTRLEKLVSNLILDRVNVE
ncbi:hypothetical protein FRC01_005637 [Tulasnella sp. 417]|nr:hypothetical protein FRC01_005637 [Tulasnella sp. 417]